MQPIVIPWPGGEHAFLLGIEQLRTIQQKTDCGPKFLLDKIGAGHWTVDELREVLRNGLIGGGMAHVDALRLVDRQFDDGTLIRFVSPSMAVLGACIFGPPDDQVGEVNPVNPTPEPEKTENGSSAPITD